MAKLVTKFKYLKPGTRKNIGGYAKYIAIREGVEKIDNTQKLLPATISQNSFINKILYDFPDSRESLEYEDYVQNPTMGTASEFISRTLEENVAQAQDSKTYADYIATRPRTVRFGSHGLFTDDGVNVSLNKVSDELNLHGGNVWTVIISLRRADASRLGFDNGERWRDMLRTQTQALATNLKIPMENLRWFAAFHNESHHPHVHLIAYSTIPNEGYLTKQGVNNLRSSLAKDIFAQDNLSIYKEQTEYRDNLKLYSRNMVTEIISKINIGIYDNPVVEEKLLQLVNKLSRTGGKKQYGYLKIDIKNIIDSIVDTLAEDERIAALYDLWYQKKEDIIRNYTEKIPVRIPLSQNPEFKSIKNIIVQEAMNILSGRELFDEKDSIDFLENELQDEEVETIDPSILTDYEKIQDEAQSENKYSQYQLAKIYLDIEGEYYNPQEALRWLIKSAKQNYTVAKYLLGKLFLHGEHFPKDIDYAVRWLQEGAEDKNPYAEYLLGKALLKGIDIEKDISRAEDLLIRSANQGNRYGAYTLGKAYLGGDNLPQNISEAMKWLTESAQRGFAPAQYLIGKLLYRGEAVEKDIPAAIDWLEKSAMQNNPYAAYLVGKIFLTEEEFENTEKAISHLKTAAENCNHFAEFQLGKIYLYGKGTPKDKELGMSYLTASATHGNQYAAQLLHSIKLNKNWSAALGSLRLIGHLARLIQNHLEDERKNGIGSMIDRKLNRQIEKKKQAHGLR